MNDEAKRRVDEGRSCSMNYKYQKGNKGWHDAKE